MRIFTLKILLVFLFSQLFSSGLFSQIIIKPVNDTICLGDTASFDISVDVIDSSFQWQIKVDANWVDLLEANQFYTGVDNDTLTVNAPPIEFQSNFYRCTVYSPELTNDSISTDSVQIIINEKPAKAETPSGAELVCKGDMYEYTTALDTTAEYYEWFIEPVLAGRFVGDSTIEKVEILWDEDFVGSSAAVFVKGINDCGEGDTSDGLDIDISMEPGVPDKPEGDTSVCGGDTEVYEISAIQNATSYIWEIIPVDAGVVEGDTNQPAVTIKWASSTVGIAATLSVAASNICGDSEFSEKLDISVNESPATPDKPTGEDILCIEASGIEYKTNKIDGVAYLWGLVPEIAGSISGDSTGILNLSGDFYGELGIYVSVEDIQDSCGTSNNSDTLSVFVRPRPSSPETPTGPDELCEGSSVTDYITSSTDQADSFIWTLIPEAAGSISGTDTIGTVTWDASFSGEASISVIGTNTCGDGEPSELLVVNVKENVIPSIQIAVDMNPVCSDKLVTFSSNTLNAGSAPIYDWKINNVSTGIDSDKFSSTSLDDGDIVNAMLISSEECISENNVVSNSIEMEVLPLPEIKEMWAKPEIGIPVVLVVCCSDSGYVYQWFEDEDAVQGANGRFYYVPGGVNTNTTYSVVVTNEAGCSVTMIHEPEKGLTVNASDLFTIFPNPSHGNFTLALNDQNIPLGTNSVTVHIYSISGERKFTEEINNSITHINIPHLLKGIYYVKLIADNKHRQIKKLVIQ